MAPNITRLHPHKINELKHAARDLGIKEPGFSLSGMLGGLLNFVPNLLFLAPLAGGALGGLAKLGLFSRIAPHLTKASLVAQLPNAALTEFPAAVSAAFGSQSRTCHAINGACSLVADHAKKVLRPNILERVSQNSVATAGFSLAMIGGNMANTAYGLWSRRRTLSQMEKDLAANVSPSVLRDNDVLKQARAEVRGWRSIASSGMGIAGMLGNVYMLALSRMKGMKNIAASIGIGMGADFVANALRKGDIALQSYRGLYENFARYGQAPLDAYTGVIAGLAPNASEKLVKEFAQKLYEKQSSPAEVLKFLSETSFFKQPEKSWTAREDTRRAAQKKYLRNPSLAVA